MTRNGFTLVEMLVAVAIFGLVAAAGVTLLSVSISTQQTTDRKLADVAELRRASALLAADLANAAPRLHRDEAGASRPAFEASAGALVLVRRGWENGDGEARSSLQRVTYRLADGRLERAASRFVDGAPPQSSRALLGGVRRLAWRFRSVEGEWRDSWDPTDARALPSAVELVADTERHGSVRQLFLVGPAT